MILIIIVVRAAPSGHQVFCVDVLPVAYRQVQLRLLICLCHSFLNPKVAYIYIYIPLWFYTNKMSHHLKFHADKCVSPAVKGLQCYGCNIIQGQRYVDVGCSNPEVITCAHSHKGFKHRFCIKTESSE